MPRSAYSRRRAWSKRAASAGSSPARRAASEQRRGLLGEEPLEQVDVPGEVPPLVRHDERHVPQLVAGPVGQVERGLLRRLAGHAVAEGEDVEHHRPEAEQQRA